MKKFYTFLSVALAGTMMVSAATRLTDVKPATFEAKQFNESKTLSTEKIVADQKKATARKAPAKAEEVSNESIDGNYIFKAYARNFDKDTNGLPSAYFMNESVPYIEVAEDNSVIIDGFWDSPFVLTGTYDPTAETITIPYDQKISVAISETQTKDFSVYVISFSTMQPSDLVLTVDAANRELYWEPGVTADGYYAETLLIGTYGMYNGSQIYDQMYNIYLDKVNSIGYSWAMDENGDIIYGDNEEPKYAAYYSYATVNHEENTVSIDNFLDFDGSAYDESGCFGYPITFALDKEAQTITATEQYIPLAFSATAVVPFYLYGVDIENDQFSLTEDFMMLGDEQESNGTTVTAFECSGVGAALLGEYNNATYGQEFYMVEYLLLEPVFTGSDSGIADVVVDNNENAPVEYFNLQGVKVANPAAGLYIRRQGNTATKVLVK